MPYKKHLLFLLLFLSLIASAVSAQSFVKTKNSPTDCRVVDIRPEGAASYLSWHGPVVSGYAEGKGDLVLWQKNKRSKSWQKARWYQGCTMKRGVFVQVDKLLIDRKKTEYSGMLSQLGEPDGEGEISHELGDIRYFKGTFHNGVPVGKGFAKMSDGTTIEGNFVDGEADGQVVRTWSNGDRFDGVYSKGGMHGPGSYYYANGDYCIGTWKYDRRDGPFTCFFPNNSTSIAEVTFVNDQCPELDAYRKAMESDMLSGYKEFVLAYPESDFREEIAAQVAKNELSMQIFSASPLRKTASNQGLGRFHTLFIGDDWEMHFSVTEAPFQLELYFCEYQAWKGTQFRAFQYPQSGAALLPSGVYSLSKKGNTLALHRGTQLVHRQSMRPANHQECLDNIWLGFGSETTTGALLSKINYIHSPASKSYREECSYKEIGSNDTEAMRAFLLRYPNGRYAHELRERIAEIEEIQANNARRQALAEQQREAQERNRLLAIRNLGLGDQICYERKFTERNDLLGFTLSSHTYTMYLICYVENIVGDRFQVRVADIQSSNDVYYKTPSINGVQPRKGDIIWIKPAQDSRWYVCR